MKCSIRGRNWHGWKVQVICNFCYLVIGTDDKKETVSRSHQVSSDPSAHECDGCKARHEILVAA
jgi:hypothetical protein